MTSSNLAKNLETAITKIVRAKVKEKAEELRQRAIYHAKEWKLDVVGWLYSTKSTRRRVKGDTHCRPYRQSGQIARAVHYSTGKLIKRGSTQWGFIVRNWFAPVASYNTWQWEKFGRVKKRGSPDDYSQFLDAQTNKPYGGYKQRATDELHHRISQIVNGRKDITNILHQR